MSKNFYNNAILLLTILAAASVSAQQTLIVGTYTSKCKSSGIYVYKIDKTYENITLLAQSDSVINPSFLSLSKDNKQLHAVSENGKSSKVVSYNFDKNTGKLQLLNRQNAMGDNPCHVIEDDKNVIIANYSGGNIAVFAKTPSGLLPAKQVVQHVGKSINEKRQEAPHAHMVCFSPDKKYLLVTDLGNDTVTVYSYNASAMVPLQLIHTEKMNGGTGPRHLVFSKNGKHVYVLNELTSTITSFNFAFGKLSRPVQTETLPKAFAGKTGSAEILISPDGKFLYASNRGDVNTISGYKILRNGALQFVAENSTLGKGPRSFTIDPNGKYLLVGNQQSNEIVVFNRNLRTGILTDTKKRILVCAPACLVFVGK